MSKAVIFFAPGLEECEGLLCVDLLRRSGVEVTIAAVGGEKVVKSARSISVVADALAEELDYSAFDAAILPGGIPGCGQPESRCHGAQGLHRVCRRRQGRGRNLRCTVCVGGVRHFAGQKGNRFTPAWKIN